jgi:hypothetical protein
MSCCFGFGCSVQAHAAAAKKEVEFWKQQLDHAVDEKKSLLERYTRVGDSSRGTAMAVNQLSDQQFQPT